MEQLQLDTEAQNATTLSGIEKLKVCAFLQPAPLIPPIQCIGTDVSAGALTDDQAHRSQDRRLARQLVPARFYYSTYKFACKGLLANPTDPFQLGMGVSRVIVGGAAPGLLPSMPTDACGGYRTGNYTSE